VPIGILAIVVFRLHHQHRVVIAQDGDQIAAIALHHPRPFIAARRPDRRGPPQMSVIDMLAKLVTRREHRVDPAFG
jgi:hypothetical protein